HRANPNNALTSSIYGVSGVVKNASMAVLVMGYRRGFSSQQERALWTWRESFPFPLRATI
ncbi:hypothetical protein, partial [Ectothiorhodospira sp. 9905]|uniref:hypothetical protein n=1 Tax=Ectothiorhodospira sp. 9905 TaxID=2897387 RepID=UPI001EE8883B